MGAWVFQGMAQEDLPPLNLDNLSRDVVDRALKEQERRKSGVVRPVGAEVVEDGVVGAEVVDDGSKGGQGVDGQDVPKIALPVLPEVGKVVTNPGELVPKDQSQVSILGYHDFSEVKSATEMRMKTSAFRRQMEEIRNKGIPVISMDEFMAWKTGSGRLPAYSVLITIDDGWKAVYTDAYPILRENGYPFTLFVYTNYINTGGASLTWEMLKEMQANGATVGSHSLSHPYPAEVKRMARAGGETYAEFLRKQFVESKAILEENLGTPVTTYCYPGGYNTSDMYEELAKAGYKAAFTVKGKKAVLDDDPMLVPRYMVYGSAPGTFVTAVQRSTQGGGGTNATAVGMSGGKVAGPVPSHVVSPKANATVPLSVDPISINLAMAGNIDPSSIVMRVSGLGVVSGRYNPADKTYSWKPSRVLRGTNKVSVSWANMGTKVMNPPVEWFYTMTESTETATPRGWIPK